MFERLYAALIILALPGHAFRSIVCSVSRVIMSLERDLADPWAA